MLRLEVVPYKGLDRHLELGRELEQRKRDREFNNFHDMGNCFIIEHFAIERGIDVMNKRNVPPYLADKKTRKNKNEFVYLL